MAEAFRYRKESERYSGREFEHDLFKTVRIGPEYWERFRMLGGNREQDYIPYRKAVELVKRSQSWEPTKPGSDFLKRLRESVVKHLGLRPDESGRVRAYTALRSHLDTRHKVDSFFEIADEYGTKLVTIDASLNPAKDDERDIRADILIMDVPDPSEDEDGYAKKIEEIGAKIAETYMVKPYFQHPSQPAQLTK